MPAKGGAGPRRLAAALCLGLAVLGAPGAQDSGPDRGGRFALVIGNGAYRQVEHLPNAVNDASDVAEKLETLGYQVDLRLDSDLVTMSRSIGAWIRRLAADPSREGFFWYAGHGIQAAGENYLLPVDIDAGDEAGVIYGSYPLGRLLLSLEETARNKLNLVILDACRDNPFKNMAGSGRGLSRGFVTVERPPQDIFIMFSTAPGTVAADGEGTRNSPFTQAFLRYIDSPEILPVMAGLITRETLRLTDGKQRPYQSGSIVSDLYYSLAPAGPAGAPARPPSGPAAELPVAAAPPRSPPGGRDGSAPPELLPLPGGIFTMGSPQSERERVGYQEPVRQVRLGPFYLAPRELSLGEFQRFAEETGYRTSAEQAGGAFAYDEARGEWEFRAGADWRHPGFRQGDDHPAVNLSWLDAVAYCNWLSAREGLSPAYLVSGGDVGWNREANGYRLPTEAEWEYACRAGTGGPFSTGNRISTAQANYNGNFPYFADTPGLFRKVTMPGASFPPNAWGLYDMHGNVWEWCWDFFGSYPDTDSESDPSGSATGSHRVNRGGGWDSPAAYLRSAARSSDFPETAGGSMGFRLARNGGTGP
jgi:formylglycine-generating enzyme required for sulfatase activity